MKFTLLTSTLALVGALSAFATPVIEKRNNTGPSDASLLQYVLTYEHLLTAFYLDALGKFSRQSFIDAGYPASVYGRITEIYDHEAEHVQFIQQSLIDINTIPTVPCTYNFGLTNPRDFVEKAIAIESTAISAYLGATPLFRNREFSQDVGSIFAVEARHVAYLSSAVNNGSAWNSAFETPLTLSLAFSLIDPFITQCPQSNPELPVRSLPRLNILNTPTPGGEIVVSITGNARRQQQTQNIAFFVGNQVQRAPITNGRAQVPQNIDGKGRVIVAVTSSDSGTPSDSQLSSGGGAFSSSSSSD